MSHDIPFLRSRPAHSDSVARTKFPVLKTASFRLQSAQRMPSERPPKTFISYSHDSAEHEQRVLALADRLSDDGVDVALDQYMSPPPANWPRWMETEMESAGFIVVVCSKDYLAKVQGKVKRGTGKGVKWENRAAIWLSSSALGNAAGVELGEDAGAGVFWAVAMMVDTSRNVRSRRIGVGVPRGKG